jgi:hypothetical protein
MGILIMGWESINSGLGFASPYQIQLPSIQDCARHFFASIAIKFVKKKN